MIKLVLMGVIGTMVGMVGCGEKECTELQHPEYPIYTYPTPPPNYPMPTHNTEKEIVCYTQTPNYPNGSLPCMQENVWRELPVVHCPSSGRARVCVSHRLGTFCLTRSMGRHSTMRYSNHCSM